MVRHEPPGDDVGDALSQDISKLQLSSQPRLNVCTKDENKDDIAAGLFSIIKVEEEHVRISQAIKQAKLYNTTNDIADSAKEIQAHIGKGVVTGGFPVKKIYPLFPETDELTLAQ